MKMSRSALLVPISILSALAARAPRCMRTFEMGYLDPVR